jgi:hypothetical protein
MTIMIIATACPPIINIGHSSDGYAYHRRGASQRGSDEKERPRQDCRTRSRATFWPRSCGCEVPHIGPPALLHSASVAVPSPCDAPGHGPTDWLRQGVRFGLGRATFGAAKAPRFGSETYLVRGIWRGAEERCFAVNPERPKGVRGQNRNLSLISVAERNQHRHSMTPGRLAAVKDRGCPPILSPLRLRLDAKNRLPPRPLLAAAARALPSLTA